MWDYVPNRLFDRPNDDWKLTYTLVILVRSWSYSPGNVGLHAEPVVQLSLLQGCRGKWIRLGRAEKNIVGDIDLISHYSIRTNSCIHFYIYKSQSIHTNFVFYQITEFKSHDDVAIAIWSSRIISDLGIKRCTILVQWNWNFHTNLNLWRTINSRQTSTGTICIEG